MSPLTVQVLGTVDVEVDNERKHLSPAQRTVLGVLVAAGSGGLSADALATEIWIDEIPPSWNASVRNAIGRIRSLLGSSAIESVGGRYRLAVGEDAVDYWRLLSVSTDTERSFDLRELTRLLDGEPFPEIEGSDRIRSARDQVVAVRHEIVERFILDAPSRPSPTALATLLAYARRNHFDRRVALLVHDCLLEVGARDEAQSLATDLRLSAPSTRRLSIENTSVSRPVRARTLPAPVARMSRAAIVGREAQIQEIVTSVEHGNGAVVLGLSGIGKSSVVSAVGAQLFDKGYDVLYGAAQSDQVSMGPFLAAMPAFAQRFGELVSQTYPSATHYAAVCAAVRQHIEDNHRGAPVCLILDDLHASDALSLEATAFLMRCAPDATFRIVVAAQPSPLPEFESLVGRLRSADITSCELDRLTRTDLRILARAVHPNAYDLVLDRLVDEVADLSAGLPGVASFVIHQAAPQTLLLPSFDLSNADVRVFDPFVRRLASSTIEAGAAGAVRGMRFQIQDLVDSIDVDESQALRACEELTKAGFTLESDRPDEFVFVHLLLRNALLGSVSKARLERLHHRMAQQTQDIHRRARHLAAAFPLASGADAAKALVESARAHMASLSWREAAAAFGESRAVDPTFTRFEDQVAFAAALDWCGADGSQVRAEAFETAAHDGKWGSALEAACSGLPGAERIDGDPQRFALLKRIPAARLTESEQALLRSTLNRQATFLGHQPPAPPSDDRTEPGAVNVQKFISQGVSGRIPEDFKPGNTFDCCDDPKVRARALQLQWIFDMERSSRRTSSGVRRRLEEATAECDDVVRDWHLKIAIGLDLRLKGEWRTANWLSQEARRHGDQFGVGDSRTAALAQHFFIPWLTGGLQDFDLGEFDSADVGTSLLTRALRIACEGAQPTAPGVSDSVSDITVEIASNCSLFPVPLLAVLSDTISRYADEEATRLAKRTLADRSGTCAVLANGVLHAGPVDRALALLADDPKERAKHRQAAIGAADHNGAALWQVQTRIEAAAEGLAGTDLIGEAESIAGGTDLEQLL